MQKLNPIHVGTGNKYQVETDYSGVGISPLGFQRYYNSTAAVKSARLGKNWRGTFDRAIAFAVDPTYVTLYRPDGKAFDFHQSGGTWSPDADIVGRLEQITGGWRYTHSQDEIETYDAAGKLVALANRNGTELTLAYDVDDRLATVTDPVGRSLSFAYDANGRLASMTDPAGGVYLYSYDTSGNLATVTYPDATPGDPTDNPQRSYLYNESAYTTGANLPNALTGIIDENNVRYATWTYDTQGRALSSEHGVGIDKGTIAYVSNSNGSGVSTVTDALGNVRTTNFQTILGVARNVGESQPGGSGCGAASSLVTYDANGNVASRTDFNGNQTTYAYDLARNLETSRTEGLTSAGTSTPQTRTITTAWHPSFRLPVSITEPGRVTSYAYDSQGNLTQKSVQDSASGAVRTWNWTYSYSTLVPGLLVQKVEDGPRTDVVDLTTTDYYAADATCIGGHNGCRGQVSQIVNALNQATQITRYNAHGQPEEIVDPNGVTTTLSYDARQRLVSRSQSNGGIIATTQYAYDPAGQLISVTLPDTSSVAYTYDAAHRLTQITDNLGNRIVYTLDAMGNRTQEDAYDALNNLVQTRSRVFDALNRLWKDIGALNQTTVYEYDANGNLTKVDGPLAAQNDVTVNSYDALNRLATTTDGLMGITRYGYDPLDQLVSVTDPRNLVTSYSLNALGDQTQLISPDTGTTSQTFDAAGNLKTRTDAKGRTATYSYDALNRVTRVAYTAAGATELASDYQYDQGVNGIGRLTRLTDSEGGSPLADASYSYDALGRLASVINAVGGMAYTTSYRHDAAGHLIGLTYPSGRSVDYTLDGAGRIASIATTRNGQPQTLVSNVTYQAMGKRVTGYTLGNGRTVTRSYDQDGALTGFSLNGVAQSLGLDAAQRITALTNPANDNRTYGYDALDRLTDAQTPVAARSYQYDADGNRTSHTIGTETDQYAYANNSNRLLSVTRGGQVRSLTHDAAGSITLDGTAQHVYDLRGRRVETTANGVTAQYRYNALGQRILKNIPSGPQAGLTFYHYDPDGKLLAESDSAGNALREYFYLDGAPVAVGE